MLLILLVLIAAVGLGLLFGGRVRRLAHARFRYAPVLVVALVAQAAVGVAGPIALAVSQVAPIGFLWANRALPGMPLVAAGFALNAAVIVANGATPVARWALVAVGGQAVPAGRHRLLEESDALRFLADVIPLPPLASVVSVGDVVLAAGVGVLVVGLMRRSSAEPVERRGETVAQ